MKCKWLSIPRVPPRAKCNPAPGICAGPSILNTTLSDSCTHWVLSQPFELLCEERDWVIGPLHPYLLPLWLTVVLCPAPCTS